jgi:hypothetical protein
VPGATTSGLVGLFAAGTILVSQFDVADWRRRTEATLRAHVAPVIGSAAPSCGIAWLPAATERVDVFPRREKEIAAALACVHDARRQRLATWAFWQYQGFDSTVMGGLGVTSGGDFHLLHYDSYPSPPGRFDATPCGSPRLDASAQYGIACGPAPFARQEHQ